MTHRPVNKQTQGMDQDYPEICTSIKADEPNGPLSKK